MRTLALLFFLIIFEMSYAQIIVDRSDFGNIGDTVLFERTLSGLDSLSPGPGGVSQVWDFSSLQIDSVPDTLFFLDPSGFAQSGDLSPSVNLVIQDGNSLQFAEANTSGIFGHALTLDFDTFFTNLLLESTPKIDIYNFPMSFGDISNGTHTTNTITLPVKDTITIASISSYVDSVRINPTINKNDTVDAYGQLLLPGQQQYDVLRQKSTLTISLSLSVLIPNPLPFPPPFIWFPLPGGTFPDIQNSSYTYVTNGKNYPVLEINTDSANQILSARFQFDTTSNDSTVALENAFDNLSLFPNPVEELLLLKGLESECTYSISNTMGADIRSGIIRKEENQIDLRHLPSGLYILTISSTQSKGITQFRVLKK